MWHMHVSDPQSPHHLSSTHAPSDALMGRVVQAVVYSPLLQKDASGKFLLIARHTKAQPGYRG